MHVGDPVKTVRRRLLIWERLEPFNVLILFAWILWPFKILLSFLFFNRIFGALLLMPAMIVFMAVVIHVIRYYILGVGFEVGQMGMFEVVAGFVLAGVIAVVPAWLSARVIFRDDLFPKHIRRLVKGRAHQGGSMVRPIGDRMHRVAYASAYYGYLALQYGLALMVAAFLLTL
ncbi:hypothetical protein [Sulfurivirga sp.]|uniref:hypothetical protein n=1 Tax=Sulfurivirga sp. TaxID=2614236 RepID=UPI0025E4302D|nr:hypothetical protein [Sulfurivirga sp.]